MSKTDAFRFVSELWSGNRDLRACSPGARSLWLDILCVCHANAGYLHINGQPADDTQLARMVGEPVKAVRAWLKELGEAGIYSVDNRGLYSSRMVKEFAFAKQAKTAGARGAAIKKSKPNTSRGQAGMPAGPVQQTTAPAVEARVSFEAHGAVPLVKKPKALPWYKSPAGWVRYGASQAMSMQSGESLEEFQCRLAARIPPGMHMDVLTPTQQRMVEALRPKDPNAKPE